MTTTPATRIRRVRTTARAIERSARRHGLSAQCARGLAQLGAAMAHRGCDAPYAHIAPLVASCVVAPRVRQFMEIPA